MQEPVRLKLRRESNEEVELKKNVKKNTSASSWLKMLIPAILLLGLGAAGVYVFQSGIEPEKNEPNLAEAPAVQGINSIDAQQKEQNFTDEDLRFSFRFKDELTKEDLSEQDREAGFIARLSSDDPALLISVRKESGLRLPATLAKVDAATLLKNNIDMSLPQRYPDFDLETSTTVTVNGKSVIERVFTYTGPSGERAKQRLLAILNDDDTAVYISMQSEESNYEFVNSQFFENIKTSIRFSHTTE